ncbi:TonB-dependent receptor [Shewanella colwelliana]|uniref:TonB-dependent receptor n=1 Tax=Shewanella colwelliana TaxID=23 RepID=UPI001BC62BDB|nr:TonB-dependent receptor [Shewanella colwelliana]GIU18534.1 TonB-dependent receptor [Shewanella colwelliana]
MGTQPTKIAVLLGAILSVSAPLHAAEQTLHNAIEIDETITVIGRNESTPLNIAANVNVIEAAAIEMSGATTLTDVLRGQSGIQFSDSNSGAVFAMRGFSADQAANNTLILIDGRRLNNIDIAAPSINSIPLNQIERVEILSGSAGVLYGDQAVGGVINIITKAPNSTGGSVQVSAGSFDTYEGQGDVSVAINDKWRLYAAASYNQGDNYRDHNANQTASILGRLQYQDGGDRFFVETSYYDNERELAGALTKEQFDDNPRQANLFYPDDIQHEMTSAVRAGYQHQLNRQWLLSADLNYADTDVNSISWGNEGKITRSLLEFNPKAVATFSRENGDINLVAGADFSQGKADYDLAYITRNNTQRLLSAYVQADVPLTQSLSYVVGGRYSDVQDDLTDVVLYPEGDKLDNSASAFELGINYRPSKSQRFYLRADDNFRFAKVDEQAYTLPEVKGLNPQTGRSYEAGWDWTLSRQTLRISAYRLDLEDEIVYVWSPEGGANMNADASRRYGASADWDWQITTSTQVGLEYHYIDAKYTEGANDGKVLPWVAEHTGRGYVSVDFAQHWQLFAEGLYTGSRYEGGDNGNYNPKIESYLLSNLALNYTRDAWLASLRVDNLFDEQYASAVYYGGYYSGTGRAVRLTASYRF